MALPSDLLQWLAGKIASRAQGMRETSYVSKRLLCAVSVGCLALCFLAPSGVSRVTHAAQSAPTQSGAAVRSASPDTLKVVLLGSGMGPRVNLQQFGASTLVEGGNIRLLVDCGRGATLRLTQVGVSTGSISRLFLTHLHSDHVIDIPDLLLAGWAGGGRSVPLEVWGPAGTGDMMEHVQQAFAFDIHMRRDVDDKRAGDGIRVVSHDIKEGVVFDEQGVKVTAFLVDHGLLTPAFGYRVDYSGRSLVLSGDTRPSENLIRFAQGVDVLVHEVFDPETNPEGARRHTTPGQAGELFTRVKPRLAVYSHAPNTESVMAQTRRTYAGPLQGAEDMLTIEIGDKIDVRHFAR
jgi:ribonuclease Z